MKRRVLYSLLIAFCLPAMAVSQKAYEFKVAFTPNTNYTTQVSNTGFITVKVDTSEEMKAQLAAAGQTFPMEMEMNQMMESTLSTDKRQEGGALPAVLAYNKMEISQTMNGKAVPTMPTNPLLDAEVLGEIDGREFKINTVSGENVTPQIEQMVKSTVEKMFDAVQFPDAAMKIGEQFTVDVPFSLPVMGKTMEIAIKTTYTLKEVKGKLAFFDVVQAIAMDADMDGVAMKATGEGIGKLDFNMGTSYIDRFQTDMKMKMNMNIPMPNNSMKMNMVMDMKSITINTITKN